MTGRQLRPDWSKRTISSTELASSVDSDGTTTWTPGSTKRSGPTNRNCCCSRCTGSWEIVGRRSHLNLKAGNLSNMQNWQQHQKPFLLYPSEKSSQTQQSDWIEELHPSHEGDQTISLDHHPQFHIWPSGIESARGQIVYKGAQR